MDTHYFRHNFGVMVFRDNYRKKNLYWQFVKYETIDFYKQGISHLSTIGWEVQGIVCDGRRGIFKAFNNIPIQMCHYHQKAIITRYLTQNPKQQAAVELKTICNSLTRSEKEIFSRSLITWTHRWEEFLKERTIDSEKEKWHYTHKRLRSAIRSLKSHLNYLFTYKEYEDLDFPNTTNSLEGCFNNLSNKLRNHPGMKDDTKIKLVDYFLSQ